EGCRESGCALIGGETAEMPGLYAPGDFDLAGTIVGVVDRKDLITGDKVRPGDVILGLPSSGMHTNGYSLARKVLFERGKLSLHKRHPKLGKTLAEALLAPHRCYADVMLPLMKKVRLNALAHLTGGGFTENIPRVLPANCRAVIRKGAWTVPPLFQLIVDLGQVPEADAYRTLNMGIGLVILVRKSDADKVLRSLKGAKVLGWVEKGPKEAVLV
ncbi:MAG TPA: phosphoribosylformylglycinamidine cyclo-ligase, partial [bacterium]|nr:phosphoribosylformylglycinamidine cyclo-ligase [bacterium]